MQQWQAEFAVETPRGPKTVTKTYYLPSVEDVRKAVQQEGGYVLTIRPHNRSVIERYLARSSWWQVQLLRGIQFRATSTSPSVAFWRLIEAEDNPRRQNILAPAREALQRGLGVIDALKALKLFDHSTLAILSASERSNRLHEGIPHAIQNITNKRKNMAKIGGTMAWLGFDIISITQAMIWGKGLVLKWFRDNPPNQSDTEKYEQYLVTVSNLELLWNILIVTAIAAGIFMAWCIFSYWINRGNRDWPTARVVRRIPLIGAYMRDLGFADSTSAAARMIRGEVAIADVLEQSSEATNVPDVSRFWLESHRDLSRGVALGAALDRDPLNRNERMELATVSDLIQVATVLESISEMRARSAKTKGTWIVWLAFGLSGVYLLIAFGSAIYALTVMNISMDSLMNDMMMGGI